MRSAASIRSTTRGVPRWKWLYADVSRQYLLTPELGVDVLLGRFDPDELAQLFLGPSTGQSPQSIATRTGNTETLF